MFGFLKNKINSFIKNFNESLNYDDNEIDDYLLKNGVSTLETPKEEAKIDKQEEMDKELQFEKSSNYVFHVFRATYNTVHFKVMPDSIKYVKTYDTEHSFKAFLKKIDCKTVYERKTLYKWKECDYPFYYLDYLNKLDSSLVSIRSGNFLLINDVKSLFTSGIRDQRITIPDYKTCLKEIPTSNNDELGNGFLIFVSKKFNSIEIKKEMLNKELERINQEILNENERVSQITKEHLIAMLKSDDNDEEKVNDKIKIHSLKDSIIRIKNELLILNKIS